MRLGPYFSLALLAFPLRALAQTPPVPDPSALVPPPTPASPTTAAAPPSDGAAPATPAAEATPPSGEAAPPPSTLPPPAYYFEPPPERAGLPGPGHAAPPRQAIWEPPPPLKPHHIAPRTSFWLGGRIGWFVPFGGVFAKGVETGPYLERRPVPWRDYVASGPVGEIQIGARVARNYNVFVLWERAAPGNGDGSDLGKPETSETDFWGVGLRASSDANRTGFLTEVAIGYRRARTEFEDGSALELTDGLLEARIGLGADIRLGPKLSISPMATLGVGSFGEVEWVSADGVSTDLIGPLDDHDAHGWFTIGIGAHADLFGQN